VAEEAFDLKSAPGRFSTTSNITATLTANIFGTKHNIDNQETALETTNGSPYMISTLHELRFTNAEK